MRHTDDHLTYWTKHQKYSDTVSFLAFSLPNILFAFNIFTPKCAFRHSGAAKSAPKTTVFQHCHFQICSTAFDIRTSKSAPRTSVFEHFHFLMCFSPQRRAIFRHQNFKKFSEDYSFLTFSLPNVPFATAACIFSTSARTKVVQTRHVLYILTSELLHSFRHQNFKKCSEDFSF